MQHTVNLFKDAIECKNKGRPPVWFMRQAGRYHSHYQALRAKHSFIDLCKKPDLASEVTRGPIEDFGFDAAILFSDLLFPLEAMGMGLQYNEGPKLDWHLKTPADLKRLKGGASLASHMNFQAEALQKIRTWLSPEKGLIGFVGGPLTLFFYAAAGSHKGDLAGAHTGLKDGRFEGFFENLVDLLAENMALQARAGADVVAIFDTCGGELTPADFARYAVPALRTVIERFQKLVPNGQVLYYSKGTGPDHWRALDELPIRCMGIDWHHDLDHSLKNRPPHRALQGNIDPDWLFLESNELESRLRTVFESVKALPAVHREGWVCGLGHGVLPKTPVQNVKLFLNLQKEIFG